MINTALFGITAKQWRKLYPNAKGNIRDSATIEQLIVLSNLETMNAEFIRLGSPAIRASIPLKPNSDLSVKQYFIR